jgi:hypothetical protein
MSHTETYIFMVAGIIRGALTVRNATTGGSLTVRMIVLGAVTVGTATPGGSLTVRMVVLGVLTVRNAIPGGSLTVRISCPEIFFDGQDGGTSTSGL